MQKALTKSVLAHQRDFQPLPVPCGGLMGGRGREHQCLYLQTSQSSGRIDKIRDPAARTRSRQEDLGKWPLPAWPLGEQNNQVLWKEACDLQGP